MTEAKLTIVKPAACAHIAAYYQQLWEQGPSIGANMLRQGYARWADGNVYLPFNNLFDPA